MELCNTFIVCDGSTCTATSNSASIGLAISKREISVIYMDPICMHHLLDRFDLSIESINEMTSPYAEYIAFIGVLMYIKFSLEPNGLVEIHTDHNNILNLMKHVNELKGQPIEAKIDRAKERKFTYPKIFRAICYLSSSDDYKIEIKHVSAHKSQKSMGMLGHGIKDMCLSMPHYVPNLKEIIRIFALCYIQVLENKEPENEDQIICKVRLKELVDTNNWEGIFDYMYLNLQFNMNCAKIGNFIVDLLAKSTACDGTIWHRCSVGAGDPSKSARDNSSCSTIRNGVEYNEYKL